MEQFTLGKIFEVDQLFANTDVDYFESLLVKLNKKAQTGYPKSITNDDETSFVSAHQEPSKGLQNLGFPRIKDFSKIKNISCGRLIHCLLYGWLLRGRPW